MDFIKILTFCKLRDELFKLFIDNFCNKLIDEVVKKWKSIVNEVKTSFTLPITSISHINHLTLTIGVESLTSYFLKLFFFRGFNFSKEFIENLKKIFTTNSLVFHVQNILDDPVTQLLSKYFISNKFVILCVSKSLHGNVLTNPIIDIQCSGNVFDKLLLIMYVIENFDFNVNHVESFYIITSSIYLSRPYVIAYELRNEISSKFTEVEQSIVNLLKLFQNISKNIDENTVNNFLNEKFIETKKLIEDNILVYEVSNNENEIENILVPKCRYDIRCYTVLNKLFKLFKISSEYFDVEYRNSSELELIVKPRVKPCSTAFDKLLHDYAKYVLTLNLHNKLVDN